MASNARHGSFDDFEEMMLDEPAVERLANARIPPNALLVSRKLLSVVMGVLAILLVVSSVMLTIIIVKYESE